jgi:hypothetical protein
VTVPQAWSGLAGRPPEGLGLELGEDAVRLGMARPAWLPVRDEYFVGMLGFLDCEFLLVTSLLVVIGGTWMAVVAAS